MGTGIRYDRRRSGEFFAGFAIETVDQVTDRVITPFPDREGRPICVLVRKRGNQSCLFNEKDRIIDHGQIGGFVPPVVKEGLRRVLRRYDVHHINGGITTGSTGENRELRFRNLLQARIVLDMMSRTNPVRIIRYRARSLLRLLYYGAGETRPDPARPGQQIVFLVLPGNTCHGPVHAGGNP